MDKKEKNYLLLVILITSILLIIHIVSCVFGVIDSYSQGEFFSHIFEVIYAAFHLLFLSVIIVFCMGAIKSKKGSNIIYSIMVNPDSNRPGRIPLVISSIFTLVGLFLFVYFGLYVLGVPVYIFDFPNILIYLLINVGLFFIAYGLIFFFYPFLMFGNLLKNKSKEEVI